MEKVRLALRVSGQDSSRTREEQSRKEEAEKERQEGERKKEEKMPGSGVGDANGVIQLSRCTLKQQTAADEPTPKHVTPPDGSPSQYRTVFAQHRGAPTGAVGASWAYGFRVANENSFLSGCGATTRDGRTACRSRSQKGPFSRFSPCR